jgi:uncharacterized protein YbjT (DUF2867 family)
VIAVTGATGALGGQVARLLADRGAAQRLIVRDPARAPELPGAEMAVAAGYSDTEEHVRAAGIPFTFLRDNLYLDFIPFFCGSDGVIRGPAGDGRAGFVARADVADVAAAVLTDDGHEGRTYDLTGAESISLARAAELLSRVTGREIRFHDETMEEARTSRAPSGEPDWVIEGWVTTYAAIGAGELDAVTETVQRLAGHAPYTVERWLREHPDSYRHLV